MSLLFQKLFTFHKIRQFSTSMSVTRLPFADKKLVDTFQQQNRLSLVFPKFSQPISYLLMRTISWRVSPANHSAPCYLRMGKPILTVRHRWCFPIISRFSLREETADISSSSIQTKNQLMYLNNTLHHVTSQRENQF